MSYSLFGLTLMVTHACNMRCTYCYTGAKLNRPMPSDIGDAALRRAFASLSLNGHLDLGFFGGEPLLAAPAILRWIHLARDLAARNGHTVSFHLTTNGTINSPAARLLLAQPDLYLALSIDGLPSTHDRFRLLADGRPSSAFVTETLDRLVANHRPFSVVTVVRPETAADLPASIRHLRSLGVRSIEPSLDLWTHWSRDDAAILRRAIAHAADLWLAGLPDHSLSWFDEKAAELAGVHAPSARCGFGEGELAIAPSGNLYPCERLIGEDPPDHPLRLPGHALDDLPDFLPQPHAPGRSADACHACSLHSHCNTTCRCSNFIRTGDLRRPDGLLCLLNQACLEEVAKRLQPVAPDAPRVLHLQHR